MVFLKSSLYALALLCLGQTIFAKTNATRTQTSIPLEFNVGNPAPYGGPSTIITIQGKEIPIIFDTGAKKSDLVLTKHVLKTIHVKFTGRQICFKAMDGKHCQKEFLIPEVKIGSFVVKNVKGTLMTKLWGGHDEFFKETEASRNGVIGFGLLSKFNLLLDYPNSKAHLIKPQNKPTDYDIENWVSIPFQGHLLTKLKLNDKLVTLTWDTGAIPSNINQTVAQSLKQTPCPKNNPYKGNEKCSRVETISLTTINNESLPTTWFSVQKMPPSVPFDGLVGSNFYAENLVYFDFDKHRIYVKGKGNLG